MKCPVDSGAELMPQVLCDEGGHLASHAPKIEDEGKAWPAMRDASQRRAGELHNVDRNVIWWPVRSQVRSQVTDHGGAGTAPLYGLGSL